MIRNGIGGDGPEPAGRAPAPPALRLVQDFVNSVDLEAGVDRFGTVEGLRSWLVQRELIAPLDEVGEKALEEAVKVREAIRALAAANNDVNLDPTARRAMNELLAAAPFRLVFEGMREARLEPTVQGVTGALSSMLGTVYRSIIDGSWNRLKACRRDVCHWVFYDYSRNRSGTWCAMTICGNRTKTNAYYHRRKQSRPDRRKARGAGTSP